MTGWVYLVGAGPGDPGLLTARALALIGAADVVLYDRLIPASALADARPDAKLIYVGKEGGGPSMPQGQIENTLLEHARAGKMVVRLKGGDPFVFGRGGEEAEVLIDAGIPFEVVPGVTAGVAAPAYAGIPVTHRDAASAVAFVTGHEDPAKPESVLDWSALASFPGTLVVYMGVRQLGAIAERLLAGGRSGDEPAAIVERGTLADQRVVSGTLATIASRATDEDVRAPAIAVFGPVAALRERLQWFERRPLAGINVAVTRARAQASALAERLRSLGATVVEAPAIRIVPLDGPAPELERYDLLCLTSPNGVRLLFERLLAAGRDARALAGTRVAAIGPGTAAALREHGVIADIVPERFVAEGLIDALADIPVESAGADSIKGPGWAPSSPGGERPVSSVLIARAAEARDVLPEALRERGASVDVMALYETVAETLSESELAAARAADYVTFTSSSTVRFFFEAVESAAGNCGLGVRADSTESAGETPRARARLVSIGPVTSAALRERGLEPDVEATRHDVEGVIDALVADAARAGERARAS